MLVEELEAELRTVLAQRAAEVPPGAIGRLRAVDYQPRSHRVRPRLAIGALAGSASAAAATIAIIALGAGAPDAFAGWTRSPSHVSRAQAAGAETDCVSRLAGSPSVLPANATPVLTDVRGPFTFVIYAGQNFTATCITGPGFISASGSNGVDAGVAPAGEIRLSSEHLTTRDGHPYTLVEGHLGAGVTGTTLVLDDGTKVTASIARGWFAAWWPGSHSVSTAELSTAAGTKTERLPAAPPPPAPAACTSNPCTHASGGFSSIGVTGGGSGPRSGFSSVTSAQK